MRTNGLASPEAEALAQKEDDHQRWADDGGYTSDAARPAAPPEPRATENKAGRPVPLVYRLRAAA